MLKNNKNCLLYKKRLNNFYKTFTFKKGKFCKYYVILKI